MPRYRTAAFQWSLFALVVAASARADGQEVMSPETLKGVKGATVFIKVPSGQGEASGSGFVIRADGRGLFVATNHHVVAGERGRAGDNPVTVVFDSGTPQERSARGEVVASDPATDLAILKLPNLPDPPKPIDIDHKVEPVETMALYTLGFPLGRMLDKQGRNPAITVSRGSVSSFRRNGSGRLEAIQVDGAINHGNSGGPLVDSRGRLIGIAVQTVRADVAQQIGLAIPREALLRMVEGQASTLTLTLERSEAGSSTYRVDVSLDDPFANVQSASLLYAPVDAGNRAGGTEGKELAGASRVELVIGPDRKKASGTLKVAVAASAADRRQWVQVSTSGGSKGPAYSKPLMWTLSNARIGAVYDLRTGRTATATANPNRMARRPRPEARPEEEARGLVAPFFTVTFAAKKKLAITLDRDGTARVYDSTNFAPRGEARLAGPSAQAVLDPEAGLLYAYVAVDGFLQFDRSDRAPRGNCDLHIYDVKALLTADEGGQPEALVPRSTFPRNANAVGMALSPGGKWIYALERTSDAETGGPAKIVRINTTLGKPDLELDLVPGTDTLCMTRDGRTLYATARTEHGRGLLQVIEGSSLELRRTLPLDQEPNDVEATIGGYVLIACRGGTVLVAEMSKARAVVGRWHAGASDPAIRLAPDQKRVYVGDQRSGFSTVSSWLLTGASKDQAATRTGALAAIGQNAPLLSGDLFLTPDGQSILMRSGAVLPLGARKPTAPGGPAGRPKRIDSSPPTSTRPKAIP